MSFEFGITELGLKPDEFWRLTPSEFLIMANGYNRLRIRRNNELTSAAWLTAALTRSSGKLPELKSLLQNEDIKPVKREQTLEEMIAMAKLMNAAYGGKVVEVH